MKKATVEYLYESKSGDYILTDGEESILKILRKLDRLWKKHGGRMILFAGTDVSVRIDKPSVDHEIENFPRIRCDGGDGADKF
jgi:hypothetical protein